MGWLRDIYISKNISESAVSKRSLDDSFFMGFPMVVLANSGTYYNLEQEIKEGVKGKIKHQWSLSSPCSTSQLMLMYSVYSVHQIGVACTCTLIVNKIQVNNLSVDFFFFYI